MNRNTSLSLIFLIFILNLIKPSYSHICRAITMSGAGDRGAYEVGVVAGLVDIRNKTDVEWEFATGISAGSINAALMAMFNIGDERNAVNYMIDSWLSVDRKAVWREWFPLGPLDGFLFKQGILDDSVGLVYLHQILDPEFIKKSTRGILIGATSYTTGDFQQFYKNDSDFITAVKASSSIAGLFPPTVKNGEYYGDGGITFQTPITSTTRLCVDTGASDIIIDVILGIGSPQSLDNVTDWKTPSFMVRSSDITVKNIFYKDIEAVFLAFPSTKINLYYPSQKLPGHYIGFDYSKEMIEIGLSDAADESSHLKLDKNNYRQLLSRIF